MPSIDGLQSYLKFVAEQIGAMSYEAVVLKYGQSYPAPAIARPKGIRKGKDGECFANAYHVAADKGWQYVEGFARSIIFVHHAWVIDDRGNVVETTWKEPGTEYYGIPLDMQFIHQVFLETRVYGVLNAKSETFMKRFVMTP